MASTSRPTSRRRRPATIGAEPLPGHGDAHGLALGRGPALHEVPGRVERAGGVQEAGEEGGEGDQHRDGSGVGAAHLQEALEPDIGEDGRDVVCPVRQGGPLAGKLRQRAAQEIAEVRTGDVVVGLAPLDEIHRHGQRVVDVALVTHAVLEDEREHAGARVVRVLPHRAAFGKVAVEPPVGEGRVGEQRGRERLQSDGDAQLLDHIGFAGKVVVRLHGTGAKHHVEAARADLGHVAFHDRIAALGHARNLGQRPFRAHPEVEEADAEALGQRPQRREMAVELGLRLVHRPQRRAGQFELPAWFERDGAPAGIVGEADDVLAIEDRLPAERVPHALQQVADAAARAASLIGHRPSVGAIERHLLVFRTDAVLGRRLAAGLDPTDEVVAPGQRRGIRNVASHGALSFKQIIAAARRMDRDGPATLLRTSHPAS